MMKKLLSLILVLGIVPFANAGLKWMVNGQLVDMNGSIMLNPGNVSVALYNDTEAFSVLGETYLTAIGGVSAPNPVGIVHTANLPGTWVYVPESSGDFGDGYLYWWYFSNTNPAVATFKAGRLFEVSFKFDGPSAVVNFWDESAAAPLGALTLIPEPASMLLLGLGGLFLRRK